MVRNFTKRDPRRRHSRRDSLLHQRDRLIHQQPDALKTQDDVLVILTRLSRHNRERAGDILLDTFELIHRHHQVVWNDSANRQRIVMEVETFHCCFEQITVQVVINLILWLELGAIYHRKTFETLLQILGSSIDGRLRIIRPSHVLPGIAKRGGDLWILRHPIFPVFIELCVPGA